MNPDSIQENTIDITTTNRSCASYEDTTNTTKIRKEKKRSSYKKGSAAAMKRKFLAARRMGATIADAASVAGVHPKTPYYWRNRDPEFAQAWEEERLDLVEDIERKVFNRALEGNDRLSIFILKSHRPHTYNQRPQQPEPASSSKLLKIADIAEKVRGWF